MNPRISSPQQLSCYFKGAPNKKYPNCILSPTTPGDGSLSNVFVGRLSAPEFENLPYGSYELTIINLYQKNIGDSFCKTLKCNKDDTGFWYQIFSTKTTKKIQNEEAEHNQETLFSWVKRCSPEGKVLNYGAKNYYESFHNFIAGIQVPLDSQNSTFKIYPIFPTSTNILKHKFGKDLVFEEVFKKTIEKVRTLIAENLYKSPDHSTRNVDDNCSKTLSLPPKPEVYTTWEQMIPIQRQHIISFFKNLKNNFDETVETLKHLSTSPLWETNMQKPEIVKLMFVLIKKCAIEEMSSFTMSFVIKRIFKIFNSYSNIKFNYYDKLDKDFYNTEEDKTILRSIREVLSSITPEYNLLPNNCPEVFDIMANIKKVEFTKYLDSLIISNQELNLACELKNVVLIKGDERGNFSLNNVSLHGDYFGLRYIQKSNRSGIIKDITVILTAIANSWTSTSPTIALITDATWSIFGEMNRASLERYNDIPYPDFIIALEQLKISNYFHHMTVVSLKILYFLSFRARNGNILLDMNPLKRPSPNDLLSETPKKQRLPEATVLASPNNSFGNPHPQYSNVAPPPSAFVQQPQSFLTSASNSFGLPQPRYSNLTPPPTAFVRQLPTPSLNQQATPYLEKPQQSFLTSASNSFGLPQPRYSNLTPPSTAFVRQLPTPSLNQQGTPYVEKPQQAFITQNRSTGSNIESTPAPNPSFKQTDTSL